MKRCLLATLGAGVIALLASSCSSPTANAYQYTTAVSAPPSGG